MDVKARITAALLALATLAPFGASAADAPTHILALMLFAAPGTRPLLIGTVKDGETCIVEAAKLNRTDERLREAEAKQMGAEYVCLKIVRAGL